ncbi:MAG TPA: DUF4097 family beta strand repeat-containing protein [Gemmatimonadaceae bacterium]
MRKTLIAIAAIPALLAASVVKANAQIYSAGQRVDTTMTLDDNGTLRVSVYAGRVNVTGTSGNKVHIKGTVSSGEMEIRSRYSTVTVNMDENPSRSRAELDISVPTGTSVIVEGFSAAFTVRGVKGDAKLEALSGDIQVSDAVGDVSVETVSGDISLSNIKGNARAEAVSGIVTVAGIDGDVEAESVSGRVSITEAKSKSVRAETVGGSITYVGTIDPTGNYVLKTHAGRLTLGIPTNASATVSLETFSGTVDSDFPVTLTGKTIRASNESKYEFTIGEGRSRIMLETFSGDIRIQRGTTRTNQE